MRHYDMDVTKSIDVLSIFLSNGPVHYVLSATTRGRFLAFLGNAYLS